MSGLLSMQDKLLQASLPVLSELGLHPATYAMTAFALSPLSWVGFLMQHAIHWIISWLQTASSCMNCASPACAPLHSQITAVSGNLSRMPGSRGTHSQSAVLSHFKKGTETLGRLKLLKSPERSCRLCKISKVCWHIGNQAHSFAGFNINQNHVTHLNMLAFILVVSLQFTCHEFVNSWYTTLY